MEFETRVGVLEINLNNTDYPLSGEQMDALTEEQHEAYAEKYLRPKPGDPALTAVRYSSERDRFELAFENGMEWAIPRRLVRGFEHATHAQLARVGFSGTGLMFEDADEGFDAQEVAADLFGMWTFFARMGGQARTEAKSATSRANGKKGGRPRRSPQPEVKAAA